MSIQTVFSHVSCSNFESSVQFYAKLFARQPNRRPMDGLAEWHFSGRAEVQLMQDKEKAGTSKLTLGVLPLQEERDRVMKLGIQVNEIEKVEHLYIAQLRDPDGNLVVLASDEP